MTREHDDDRSELDSLEEIDMTQTHVPHGTNGSSPRGHGGSRLRVATERDAPDTRPIIRVAASELGRMVREATTALIARDPDIYQMAGQLVTIVTDVERRQQRTNIAVSPGTPHIRAITQPGLRVRVTDAIRWLRFDSKSKELVPSAPDAATIAGILAPDATGGWPEVRPIRGILETPALAPSGEVIEKPGYHEETGYVHLPSIKIDPIEQRPTQAQAHAALRHLWTELFVDFPYVGLGESANTRDDAVARDRFVRACACPDAFVGIAALLSMFARPAVNGATPGTVFEAASQGSGKTLQINVIATAATGRGAGMMTFPTRDGKADDAELEKVIGSYALAGARMIAFDNVKGTLGGSALEKAMTAVDSIDLRVLGASEQRTLPWTATIMFSGNNMTMSDDIAQRVLTSRLESSREDPRSRPSTDYRHPRLLDWIKENRPQLVRACLTILRAFSTAEKRPDCGTWGSFEPWSELVPAAIVYAGGPNVLEARPRGSDADGGEGAAHTTLMRFWPEQLQGMRAALVIKDAFTNEREIEQGSQPPDGLEEFRAAIRELTGSPEGRIPNAVAFGHSLRTLRGKWRDGMQLRGDKDRKGFAVWRVVKRDTPKSPAPSDDPAEDFDR